LVKNEDEDAIGEESKLEMTVDEDCNKDEDAIDEGSKLEMTVDEDCNKDSFVEVLEFSYSVPVCLKTVIKTLFVYFISSI
jgi:hypothetical protein